MSNQPPGMMVFLSLCEEAGEEVSDDIANSMHSEDLNPSDSKKV
jgi:hypothetical protein